MRILAIDYGTKKTGLAITDYLQILSSPLTNIEASNDEDLIKKMKKILEPYLREIESFLIGYPLLLNGNKNETTLRVEEFINKLKNNFPDKKIITINEQFTTYIAQEELYEMGLNHKSVKKNKDKVSAYVILNSYLSKNK